MNYLLILFIFILNKFDEKHSTPNPCPYFHRKKTNKKIRWIDKKKKWKTQKMENKNIKKIPWNLEIEFTFTEANLRLNVLFLTEKKNLWLIYIILYCIIANEFFPYSKICLFSLPFSWVNFCCEHIRRHFKSLFVVCQRMRDSLTCTVFIYMYAIFWQLP